MAVIAVRQRQPSASPLQWRHRSNVVMAGKKDGFGGPRMDRIGD